MSITIQEKLNQNNEKNYILVDGLNVLKHPQGVNNSRNIHYVRAWGKENGVSPIFVLPGFRKFQRKYEGCDDVVLLDPRIYDDIAILAYAQEYNLAILSNDKFREFRKMFHELDFNWVFTYIINDGNLKTNASDFFFFKHSMNHTRLDTTDKIKEAVY